MRTVTHSGLRLSCTSSPRGDLVLAQPRPAVGSPGLGGSPLREREQAFLSSARLGRSNGLQLSWPLWSWEGFIFCVNMAMKDLFSCPTDSPMLASGGFGGE